MKIENSKFKNILIIKPSALGDVVLALPALSSLHASFPNAKISWLIRPEFAPLLAGNTNLDEIIIFDRKLLGKWWLNTKAFAALVRLITRLSRAKFDLVIDLQGLFRTALFSWLTGCKKRFGMAAARECAVIFYTYKIPQDADSAHLIDYYHKIVSAAGASTLSTDYNLTPNTKAKEDVAPLLSEVNINPDKYAVFVPGSTHRSKCWPIENFAALANKVSSQFDLSIIAVGTEREKSLVENLKSRANVPVANFAGLTDIPQLIALLNGAKLVVSNDTGPGQIAAALNVSLVMIFGTTNPARIMPYKKPYTVAAVDSENRGTVIESTNPRYTIQAVTIDQVFEKVALQLKQ